MGTCAPVGVGTSTRLRGIEVLPEIARVAHVDWISLTPFDGHCNGLAATAQSVGIANPRGGLDQGARELARFQNDLLIVGNVPSVYGNSPVAATFDALRAGS